MKARESNTPEAQVHPNNPKQGQHKQENSGQPSSRNDGSPNDSFQKINPITCEPLHAPPRRPPQLQQRTGCVGHPRYWLSSAKLESRDDAEEMPFGRNRVASSQGGPRRHRRSTGTGRPIRLGFGGGGDPRARGPEQEGNKSWRCLLEDYAAHANREQPSKSKSEAEEDPEHAIRRQGAADPLMVELSILDRMRKFKRQVRLDPDWEVVFWNGGDVGSDGDGRDAR